MMNNTDDTLLKRIKQKDKAALAELVNRFQKPVFSYLLRIVGKQELAEELVQETFTRIWFSAHLYRSQGKVKGWIFTIARNIARNEMVKKRHAYESIYDEGDSLPARSVLEVEVQHNLALEKVDLALKKLGNELQEVIVLKHQQQLTFKEMAEVTGVAESTLKSRYKKGIIELRQLMGPWKSDLV